MKFDYNKIMHDEISSFGGKPKLLLHCCCAPCSSAVIERIKEYFDITFYYYNPNIYPKEEYALRQSEFKKLGVNVVAETYNHDDFLKVIKGRELDKEGGTRCQICITERLNKTFEYAVRNNFDVVTTTLTISPHKDCEFINLLGEKLQEKYGVKYLHADLKKKNGYLRSIEICKELEIYRQDYCGCEFSRGKEKAN